MSYRSGLGALPAATYPNNTQLVAGYQIVGLTRPGSEVPGLLREAMQAAFRGAVVRTGWGGGRDAAGVPSGRVYALVETRSDGVTADSVNSVFSQVARDLQTRLGGGTVSNTHAHVVRLGSSGGGGGGSTVSDILTALTQTTGGGSTPATTPDTSVPPGSEYVPPPSEESFLTSRVAGIPMWGLLAGGTVAVGGLAFFLLRSGKKSVSQNRRRRR